MLSRELLSITESLERVDNGKVPPAAALPLLRIALCDCIERALAIEAASVPPAARLTQADLADGKVLLLRRQA